MQINIWFILGIIFILIEVAAIPGIGFLFAGFAAISLGGLITFEFVQNLSVSEQIAYFFALTIIWWVVLWKPMKKLSRNDNGGYQNIVGTHGFVDDVSGLVAGRLGNVRWSGAIMRARIRPESELAEIHNGQEVWVYEQKDGVLLVDVTKPERNNN